MPADPMTEQKKWRIIYSFNTPLSLVTFRLLQQWLSKNEELKSLCNEIEQCHVSTLSADNIGERCIIIGDPNDCSGEILNKSILKIAQKNRTGLILCTANGSTVIETWQNALNKISTSRFFVYPKGPTLTSKICEIIIKYIKGEINIENTPKNKSPQQDFFHRAPDDNDNTDTTSLSPRPSTPV